VTDASTRKQFLLRLLSITAIAGLFGGNALARRAGKGGVSSETSNARTALSLNLRQDARSVARDA
jgi:hypothetical protein